MKVVTGTVSSIRHSFEISGNQHGVGTAQIVAFRIGKQAVELGLPSLPQIEVGDEVEVAGDVVNGVLVAQAYRNFDNNAYGEWKHHWFGFTLGTLFLFLPIALFMPSIYMLPAIPMPYQMIARGFRAIRIATASRMVHSVDG